MTNIYDRQKNIFELQKLLRDLGRHREGAELINPDGILGPETVRAVRKAQKIFGFRETGIADYRTWQALFESFLTNRKFSK